MTVLRKLRNAARNPVSAVAYVKEVVAKAISRSFWSLVGALQSKGISPPIRDLSTNETTVVDSFWSSHVVGGENLASVETAYQDRRYLNWRFQNYPLSKDFMNLWGKHDDQIVLDYGCGPGNDLVGFLVYTKARKVIGIDISEKALRFASKRLALHRVEAERVELIRISDMATTVPLDDNSVDYVYSEGVLHHTTNPEAWLRELHRVLKPGCQACIMVYNRDSIWLHLYVAYDKMILRGNFLGMSVYEAFARTTDTEDCPIARCYTHGEFVSMCSAAGFRAEYVGGFFAQLELDLFNKYRRSALEDKRLEPEHREFLAALVSDERGYPKFEGKHAGIGGVHMLLKGPG